MMISFEYTRMPATEEQIYEMETLIGISLPADYRKFLQEYNGGRPHPDCFSIQWPEGHPLLGIGYIWDYVNYLYTLDKTDPNITWYMAYEAYIKDDADILDAVYEAQDDIRQELKNREIFTSRDDPHYKG